MTNTRWSRRGAGAVALAAVLAVAGPAVPAAAAAPADLAVTVDSSAIAVGSPEKTFFAKVRNEGGTTTVGLGVEFELSPAALAKLRMVAVGAPCDRDSPAKVSCNFPTASIRPGAAEKVGVILQPIAGGAGGEAGGLTVTVSSTGALADPVGNNTTTVDPIRIEGTGVDLAVVAFDATPEQGVLMLVFSQGSTLGDAFQLTTVLPEHVSFAGPPEPGCVLPDPRTEVCSVSDPAFVFGFLRRERSITVAPDAVGRAGLTGTVTVAGPDRVDPGDNTDTFLVFAPARPATPGTSASAGGGTARPGGIGGLPVTGVDVGLLAGLGAGTLAAGGLLVLMARRRRGLS